MTQPTPIECAVLEALAYSDIFDYPLRLDEIHRCLPLRATQHEVHAALSRLVQVDCRNNFYFLKGNGSIVEIRLERTAASIPTFRLAALFGRILGVMPFVRMVAITGSLAVLNQSQGADMDYMLITQPSRLWIARAFAVTFGRLMRLFGKRICVNLLVSENALAWHVNDLYSAHEMCQMIPVSGLETYRQLRAANRWTESILPNSTLEPVNMKIKVSDAVPALQKLLELSLRSKLGERFEQWAMRFQLRQIAYRGKSEETNFSADICQGNFHHHRQRTRAAYQERLSALGIEFNKNQSAVLHSRSTRKVNG